MWTSGAVKRHSDSDLVPSDMPVCEVSQEAISFSFTSWRTRACKLVARTCKKTNSDVLGWKQHFQMCGKSVYMSGWQKTDLSSMAGSPAPADCDGGCVAKTDFDVWAAQCCWLSVSRCKTEALDSVGRWVRAPTGRKYILGFFKSKKSQLQFMLT